MRPDRQRSSRGAAGWLRALLPLLLALPASAQAAGHPGDPAIALWRAADGPDTASELELTPDGHFRYGLSEGALDESAEGNWRREGGVVRLYTEPVPVAPLLTVESMKPSDGAPVSVFIGDPDGHGIAGVEFRIEYDKGDPVESYTQYDGWTGDEADGRQPRWVQLHEPIFGISSEHLPVPEGARALRFVLHPNDIGIANFRGAEVMVDGDSLTLKSWRGDRHYRRAEARRGR